MADRQDDRNIGNNANDEVDAYPHNAHGAESQDFDTHEPDQGLHARSDRGNQNDDGIGSSATKNTGAGSVREGGMSGSASGSQNSGGMKGSSSGSQNSGGMKGSASGNQNSGGMKGSSSGSQNSGGMKGSSSSTQGDGAQSGQRGGGQNSRSLNDDDSSMY